jgi:hypothetical protein
MYKNQPVKETGVTVSHGPIFVNSCLSNALSGLTLPLPCVNKYKYCMCKGGGVWGSAGLRQINTFRKVPLQVNFLDDNILLWCPCS